MNFNPYASPFPVEHVGDLYGRRDTLYRLGAALFQSNHPISQQLVGCPRSGKTSILKVLASLNEEVNREAFLRYTGLPPKEGALFVFVDFGGLADKQSATFWRFLGERLRTTLRGLQDQAESMDEPLPTDLTTFRRLLTQAREQKVTLIVFLFDEFDEVAASHPSWILPNLRYLLEINLKTYSRVAYVIATTQLLSDIYYDRDDTSRLSPLFNYFSTPTYLGLLEEFDVAPDGMGRVRSLERFQERCRALDARTEFRLDQTLVRTLSWHHPDMARYIYEMAFDFYRDTGRLPVVGDIVADVCEYYERIYRSIKASLPQRYKQALDGLLREGDKAHITPYTLRDLQRLGLVVEQSGHYRPLAALLDAHPDAKYSADRPLLFIIYRDRQAVDIDGRYSDLTPSEWKLFESLYLGRGKLRSRNELTRVIGDKAANATGALDITISRLRQKIEPEPDRPQFIRTVRGQGYQLELPDTIEILEQ